MLSDNGDNVVYYNINHHSQLNFNVSRDNQLCVNISLDDEAIDSAEIPSESSTEGKMEVQELNLETPVAGATLTKPLTEEGQFLICFSVQIGRVLCFIRGKVGVSYVLSEAK